MDNRLLHVEDNADDVMLMALAFRKAGVAVKIEVAGDGEKAKAFLSNNGSAASIACVLLDIKLPSLSGLEVLGWMRTQPVLKRLPVIMFTSSILQADINRAYDLGANSYLVKPPDLESLITLANTIDLYWLRTNARPVMPEG